MITAKEAAEKLNNSEYREEGTPALFAEMKAAGLVAVFGASDDLVEFRGAIEDEVGAYQGITVSVTSAGLMTNKCKDEDCPYSADLEKVAVKIEAVWGEGDISWTFKTTIPHETFDVQEDGEPYCRGIVFALADVQAAPTERNSGQDDAVEILHLLMSNPHLSLGDQVYQVRDREGQGWDGPSVKLWSDALTRAKTLFDKLGIAIPER